MNIASIFADVKIKYDELVIRELQKKDLDLLAKWPQYGGSLLSWANFKATTPQLQDRWYSSSFGPFQVWLLVESLSYPDQLIGRISITQPVEGKDLVYGIVIRPDLLDRGFGSKATKMILKACFDFTDTENIWLETQLNNLRARHAWSKLGFIQQPTHYRREVDNRFHQMIGYSFPRSKLSTLPTIVIER